MPRYHVSSDGTPRTCKAQVGACPLTEADGSSTPHGDFANAQEANAFAESVNAKRYGGSFGSVAGQLDKSSIKPAYHSEDFPNLYPAPKAANAGTVRDLWDEFDDRDIEEYGDDHQEFKDSSGDRDEPVLELTVQTSVFDDNGKVLSSNEQFSRVYFEDDDDKQSLMAENMSAEDAAELSSNGSTIREEWPAPNKRVTYRMESHDGF